MINIEVVINTVFIMKVVSDESYPYIWYGIRALKPRYVGESTRSILDKPAKNLEKSVIRVAEEIFRILWFLDSILGWMFSNKTVHARIPTGARPQMLVRRNQLLQYGCIFSHGTHQKWTRKTDRKP